MTQVAAENGYTPVVATIATDNKGQALNINADIAAGEVSVGVYMQVVVTNVCVIVHDALLCAVWSSP